MTITIVALALLAGFGILLVFMGVFGITDILNRPKSVELTDPTTQPEEEIEVERTVGQKGEMPRFLRTTREQGLNIALRQAELDITVPGFMQSMAIVGGLTFVVGWVLTGTPVVALFLVFISMVVFLQWLFRRRDTKRLEYEEALASMADRLASGAKINNSLRGAFEYAVPLAPDAVKGDFEYLLTQIQAQNDVTAAFQVIRDKRGIYALDLLLGAILTWNTKGASKGLQEVLKPVSDSIRMMSSTRKSSKSELRGLVIQVYALVVAPIIFVSVVKNSNPLVGPIYNQPIGWLMQIVSYSISTVGFMVAQQQFNRPQKLLEVES